MKDDPLSRATIITDRAAGAVFANSRLRRILMLFASGPLSLSEAALRANLDLKRLHHHVAKLTRLGLLEIVGVRRRPGRAIKLYRATNAAFLVPEEIFPRPFGQDLSDEMRECLAAQAAASARFLLLTVGPKGEPLGRIVEAEDRAAQSFEMWRILRLSKADLERLRSEIDAVFSRFQPASRGGAHVYLVHAAAARRRDESGPVDNP